MKKLFYFSPLIYLLALIPTQVVFAQAHQDGTNVVSGQQVYTVQHAPCPPAHLTPGCPPDLLRAYSSAAVFLSYKKNSWTSLVQANGDDLALGKGPLIPFAFGTLVNDNGTIYVMSDDGNGNFSSNLNDIKYGIPDATTFLSLGYKWSNVVTADTSFMPAANTVSASSAHLPGTLVNDKGTIYYITKYGKIGITSMDEFTSKGFNLQNVVPANKQDISLSADMYGWAGTLPQ